MPVVRIHSTQLMESSGMINNAETDWGHNSTTKGIHVGSMSFGSLSSPLNPGDEGDNGTGGEARLINNATESADIVCVIAMGNDGTKRVPSPASADLGFCSFLRL